MKLYLIGYRCTGKTTVGKILAHRLSFDFLDIDESVEHTAAETISQIVTTDGWERFRQLEKQLLLTTKSLKNTVISTGGGIIMDPENIAFFQKTGVVIWLDAKIDTIITRLTTDTKTKASRPSITLKDFVTETRDLVRLRKPLYKKIAHIKIDTSFDTPEEIVNIIDRRLSDVRL